MMTRRVVSGEEKLFLVVLALLGKDILESEGETLSSFGDTLFLALSLAATVTGIRTVVAAHVRRRAAGDEP